MVSAANFRFQPFVVISACRSFGQVGSKETFATRCADDCSAGVSSTGGRNTLVFSGRWSEHHMLLAVQNAFQSNHCLIDDVTNNIASELNFLHH
jgi:hypothetical protein